MTLLTLKTIEDRLFTAGAKTIHVEHFFRTWVSMKVFNDQSLNYPKLVKEEINQLLDEMNNSAQIIQEEKDGEDSSKLIVRLQDGEIIESVLLPRGGLCVSCQVGCAVGCVFCMTGKSGLVRQLTDFEIVSQLRLARQIRPISKVVFMGMGEPSHNRRNVLSAIDFMAKFSGIGYKNLVLSTVGDRRLFNELEQRTIKPALAISLHTTSDEKRKELLPNAERIPVIEIMDFASRYAKNTHYPIQYQWTLIRGLNDDDQELDRLEKLWLGQFAIMNMIPVNSVEGSSYVRPDSDRLSVIEDKLRQIGVLLKYRESAAQNVNGGCGQLRARYQAQKDEANG